MVKIASIQQSNAAFAADHSKSSGLICVFAGATSGIGASTLETLVPLVHDSKFYVLGRSAKRFEPQQQRLREKNPSCEIIFVEADVSLLAADEVACEQIKEQEERVDLLYMSQGLVPLNGAEYTPEGLEICFALSYYSRIRLLMNLLPLLRKSLNPRVLSVLNAGKEQAINTSDLGLEDKANWSTTTVINHTTTMMSLALNHIQQDPTNSNVKLMHAYPGLVRTEIFSKLRAPGSSSFLWSIALACIRNVVGLLMLIQGITPEESGERHAYHLTSDAINRGSVVLINETSEEVPPNPVLRGYLGEGMASKVWDFTMQVFDKVLSQGPS